MRKPIFLKLALLIIPIVLVLDAIVLFLSYRITYESNIESYQATIKNAAELATDITGDLIMDLHRVLTDDPGEMRFLYKLQ